VGVCDGQDEELLEHGNVSSITTLERGFALGPQGVWRGMVWGSRESLSRIGGSMAHSKAQGRGDKSVPREGTLGFRRGRETDRRVARN